MNTIEYSQLYPDDMIQMIKFSDNGFIVESSESNESFQKNVLKNFFNDTDHWNDAQKFAGFNEVMSDKNCAFFTTLDGIIYQIISDQINK